MTLLQLTRLIRRMRAHKGLGVGAILSLLLVSILGNAFFFYAFDHNAQPDLTVGDALWYSVISITTIGYGDFSAQSAGARIATVIFIVIVGLAAFSAFAGFVIDWMSTFATASQRGLRRVMADRHVLIVNFPSERRVLQIIREIRSDPDHAVEEIVIVTDQIAELPFNEENVLFVRGSIHDPETYRRARIDHAAMAIVLSRDYADPNSDAVVSAAASVIDSLHPEIHIVAECLDEAHRDLFKAVRCDAIVAGLRIAGNLLVQELHDPGVTQLIEMTTTNQRGSTFYTTRVTDPADETYNDLARRLLDKGVNLIGVNRGPESHTTFNNLKPQTDDQIVYVHTRRLPWDALRAT